MTDAMAGILATFERFGGEFKLGVVYDDIAGVLTVVRPDGVSIMTILLESFIGWNNSLEGLDIIRGLMYRLSREAHDGNNVQNRSG